MIWIAYIIATIWAVSTAAISIWTVLEVAETTFGRIIGGMVMLVCWLIIGLSPFYFIKREYGPELAVLLKSEWHCAQTSSHLGTSVVMVGKVPVVNTITVTQCDIYARGSTE